MICHATRQSREVGSLVTALLVVLCLPVVLLARPAGPVDAIQEEFRLPPRQDTLSARAAWPMPHRTVASANGVHQRLLHPVNFRSRDLVLPDFQDISDVNLKKTEFFRFLKPLVAQENQRILDIRRRLGFIQDHLRFQRPLDQEDSQWLEMVAQEFRLPSAQPHDPAFWEELLRRVDSIPEDLVLVQAANESAWGTSRFAREGNNLFGQWCFRPGCGMVPEGRPAGARYEVAAFDSISDSIRSYLKNLNTGRVYGDLRRMREDCRREGREPQASELAKGLTSYSERGMAYVTEIRAMLRHNAPVIAQLGPQ
jgi:Bax protein